MDGNTLAEHPWGGVMERQCYLFRNKLIGFLLLPPQIDRQNKLQGILEAPRFSLNM